MSEISKLAEISPGAVLGKNVKIGPFCVVGPDVVLGDNCQLFNNVTIIGNTKIGNNNVFYQNSIAGSPPQDLKYQGQPTETIIGENNVFREFTVVHRGTEVGGGVTIIGDNNLFMGGAHIAHDCIIDSRIIIGNNVLLAGHVKIEYGAMVAAMVGIHHFTTIGKNSYVGGMTPVRRDVPPYTIFEGDPNQVRGINIEGLKRHGFDIELINTLKKAYNAIYRRSNSLEAAARAFADDQSNAPEVRHFAQAIVNSCSSRFGRYLEIDRKDKDISKLNRKPVEVRKTENQ